MVKKNFFDGKVVLITGSTRGIGLAIAKAFSNEGALIGLNGRDERVVEEAMKDVPNSISAAGDVSKVSGCKKAVQSVLGQYGRLDILINNAGIFEKHSIEDTTEEIWDSVMNANIKSVQFCTKEAIPALRKVKGSIVNIASESGLNGYPYTTAYCASKGAVVNLTRAMAMELAPDVRVNALCPGVVETDMTRAGFAINGDEEEGIRRQHEAYPLQRIGTLEEAAAAQLYF